MSATYLLLGSLVLIAVCGGLSWAIGYLYLRGKDLARFDQPAGQSFATGNPPSDELKTIAASFNRLYDRLRGISRRDRLPFLRHYVDTLFAGRVFDAVFTAVEAGGVPAEWVLAPNADGNKRILYIHGGAFTMGSPLSHRTLTTKFSAIAGAAVLAIDYRLMPEHSRMAGIEDCRTAYRWILENGPGEHGQGIAAKAVFIAGDSAGGNLSLSLTAWIRDLGMRQPNAVVALSPATDSTFGSPSLKTNMATDPMLGPMFKPLTAMPKTLLLWTVWRQTKICPRSPLISPVYGDLSNLPPVLVHVSEAELLADDGRRYANKGVAAGSPITLQTWPHMVHVWQMFNPDLAEAEQAFDEIGKFLLARS